MIDDIMIYVYVRMNEQLPFVYVARMKYGPSISLVNNIYNTATTIAVLNLWNYARFLGSFTLICDLKRGCDEFLNDYSIINQQYIPVICGHLSSV